jgi:hypothetical protein
LAAALGDAGHEVRTLCAGRPVEPLPPFASIERTRPAPRQWTDRRIADWRTAARRALDREVDDFDPTIIHCQQLWLFAQLAVETGVPLCVTAGSAELRAYHQDRRMRRFVDQVAWNAGRVLAEDLRVRRDLIATWPNLDAVTEALPQSRTDRSRFVGEARLEVSTNCLAAYERVLAERFGAVAAR